MTLIIIGLIEIWLSVPLVILLKVHKEVAYLLQLVSGGGER